MDKSTARRGAVAIFAQGVNSISNLMVAIVVARTLGPSALGHFAFLFTLLLTFVALQSAWVGDSLTVLDRGRPLIRDGVATTQWLHVLGGLGLGGLIAYYLGGVGLASSIVFAVLVGSWELEEFGRRMFMARLEFWKQAANDASYLIITAVCLGICAAFTPLTLTAILCCMTIGALGAFLLGAIWLPSEERLRRPSSNLEGLREVSSYGFWRGAQSGAGYLTQSITRGLVIALASAAIMGQIEAARLVISPLTTLIAALTNVMLASFARSAKANQPISSRLPLIAIGCGAVCIVYGMFVFAMPNFLTQLLGGSKFHADQPALIGWLLQALVLALFTPYAVLALVVSKISLVFRLKFVGLLLEIILTVAVLVAAYPSLMPACSAAGTAVGGVMIWRLVRNTTTRSKVNKDGLALIQS